MGRNTYTGRVQEAGGGPRLTNPGDNVVVKGDQLVLIKFAPSWL